MRAAGQARFGRLAQRRARHPLEHCGDVYAWARALAATCRMGLRGRRRHEWGTLAGWHAVTDSELHRHHSRAGSAGLVLTLGLTRLKEARMGLHRSCVTTAVSAGRWLVTLKSSWLPSSPQPGALSFRRSTS